MSRRQTTFLVVGYAPKVQGLQADSTSSPDLHATVHNLASERGGRIIETTSRDLVAAFTQPADALYCALALRRRVSSGDEAESLAGWDHRLGIDTVAVESEAAYDEAIAEARRLRETAERGAIRISPLVFEAAQSRMGLEWDSAPDRPAVPRSVADPDFASYTVAATTRTSTPTPFAPTPAQRRASAVAAGLALALGAVTVTGFVANRWLSAPPARTANGMGWEPLTIGVSDARVGGINLFLPSMQRDRTRILLTVGITNRTDREVELRRHDFRLEIGGREVSALPPIGWNTRFDDSLAHLPILPRDTQAAFRFDRHPLLPGGSTIVGLQFEYPLEPLDRNATDARAHQLWHPFTRWTTGMVVERLGADAPGLQYRGRAGHLRVDLATDPFGRFVPVGQPSRLGPQVAVYETMQPVHLFNAHRLWSFVEQELNREARPIVVNLRRWPSPDPAVRAFFQSRAEQHGNSRVAFVADGTPINSSGIVFGPARPGGPQVWFARETDAAAKLIGRMEDGPARLHGFVKSSDYEVREAAIRALARDSDGLTTRLLLERLASDPTTTTRTAAANALGESSSRSSSVDRALARAADDPEAMVRTAAFASLVKREAWHAGRASALRELERVHPIHYSLRIVGKCGEKSALPRMLELIREPGLTYEAAQAVAELGDSATVPKLVTALNSVQTGKEEILRALGRLADESQRGAVVPLLRSEYARDTSFSVRRAVIEAAAEVGGPDAVRLCVEGLSDTQFPVRQAAARALGRLKVSTAIENLEGAMKDPAVAADAAKALGAIHTPAAREALDRIMREGDAHARAVVRPVLAAWD